MLINNLPFETSISDIIATLKVELESSGVHYFSTSHDTPDNYMVCCPYHKDGQERRPSAGIKKTDGTFHCFACGQVHTLPEMISHCFGRDDDVVGAIGWNWLVKNFLSVEVQSRGDIELNLSRTKDVQKIVYVDEDELDSYRYYHPYMFERKMTVKVIEIFDVGYDAKTKCITFPVRDITGRALFVARRSVEQKYFNYPCGAEKPVYGLYELSQLETFPDEVIICESMIDAITAWVYGKYAVALNGLGNELQFKQLRDMPCRKFILGTDNDDAGKSARARLKRQLPNKILTEYVFPSGRKDINDLSKKEFDNLLEIF